MKKYLAITLLTIASLLPTMTVGAYSSYTTADKPAWVMAPSIGLFAPIEDMGINAVGELDVPSGLSNNVGWYKDGVVPGESGTAVLDAHVFAAFKNLSQMKAGEYIYMFMQSGKILSFMVTESNLYSTSSLSPLTLFAPTASKQLNLITCAGDLTSDFSTYTHRLIVSAKLV